MKRIVCLSCYLLIAFYCFNPINIFAAPPPIAALKQIRNETIDPMTVNCGGKNYNIVAGATQTTSETIHDPIKVYGAYYGCGGGQTNVTEAMQKKVRGERLLIGRHSYSSHFGDPAHGQGKYITIKYSVNNGPIISKVLYEPHSAIDIKGKNIKIYSAFYGAGGTWPDVTKKLADQITKNGDLSLPGWYNSFLGDPAYGKQKYLTFSYQVGNGPIKVVNLKEGTPWSSTSSSHDIFPITAKNRTKVKGTIRKTIPNFSKSTILKLDSLYNNGIAWLDQAIQNPNKTTVTFRAQANNDIHVNFATREDFQKNSHTWQIVIGGANNTLSIIRKHGKDVASVNVKQNPSAAVSEGRYELYWISIDNGFIMVGKGFPGENIMMCWRDPNPPNRVNRIGFSSWNKPIKYAEVQTLPPIVPQAPISSYYKFKKSVKKLETPMRLNDLGGIAFQSAPKNNDFLYISFKQTQKTDTYQFVLTSGNISLNRQGKTILTTATPANIKHNGQARKYWASLNNGFLILGYGNAGTSPLLIWKDPKSIKNIKNIEIKTKNNITDFNNIEIIPPICINLEKKKEGYKKERAIFQYKCSVTIRYPFHYEIFQTGPTVNVKDLIYNQQKSLVGMKEPGATYQYLLVIKKDGIPELKQLQSRTESPLKVEWRKKARVDVISANEKESIADAKQQMSNSLTQAGAAIGGMGGSNPYMAGAAAVAGGYMVKKGLDKAKEAYGERLGAAALKKQAALLDLQREEMFKELGFVLTEKFTGRKIGETTIPPDAIKNKEIVEKTLKEIRDKKYSPFILKHFSILIDKYNYIVDRINHPHTISDQTTKKEILKGIGNLVNAIDKYNELKEKPLSDYKNLLTLLINIHDNYYIYDQGNKADESYKLKFYFGLSKIFHPIFEEYNTTTLGFNIAPFHGEYVWLKDKFEIPEKGSIHFEAQGIAEIVIGLAQKPGKTRNTNKEFYEIAIGKWSNTASDISLKIHDQTYTTKEILEKNNEHAVATPIDFKKYWISINNGKISLGINKFEPKNKLIEWKDPYPIKSIKRIGLSSGNHDITYRGVTVGPPVEEWKELLRKAQAAKDANTASEKATNITLYNKWISYGEEYETVSAKKDVENNIVYVEGLVKNGNWNKIAVLPVGFRPTKHLVFHVNNHASISRVDVEPNGTITWRSGGKKHGLISLSGITFSTIAGTPISLNTSHWKHEPGKWGPAAYRKVGNVVYLEGDIEDKRWTGVKSPAWGLLGTLPLECRPKKQLIFNTTIHSKPNRIDIHPNGQIHWVAGTRTHKWISLSGISFNTEEEADLKLVNNWKAYGGTYGKPTYKKEGNIVYVQGLIRNGSFTYGKSIAILPEGFRPTKRLVFSMNNHENQARVDVDTNGNILWVGGGKDDFISFSGISFSTTKEPTISLGKETLASEKFKQITINLTKELSKLKKENAKTWLKNFTNIVNNFIGQPKEELKFFTKLVKRIKSYNKLFPEQMNKTFGNFKQNLDTLVKQASISMVEIIEASTKEIKFLTLKTVDHWIKKILHIINNITADTKDLHTLSKLINTINTYLEEVPDWSMKRMGEKNIEILKNEIIPKAKKLISSPKEESTEKKEIKIEKKLTEKKETKEIKPSWGPGVKLRKIEREAREDEKIRTGEEEEEEEYEDDEDSEEDDDEYEDEEDDKDSESEEYEEDAEDGDDEDYDEDDEDYDEDEDDYDEDDDDYEEDEE